MLSNGPGNITSDGVNAYLYDAEDRLCAVHGAYGMVGYQYDAEGNRISKGSITIWSCDITSNGFQPQSDYILDQGGGQETEMAVDAVGTEVWQHTNVWAAGQLIATYDTAGQHFYFNDALGSRRYQTDSAGAWEQTCQSLPFGDNLQCSGSTSAPTEHHFTGKERDPESGLDFFMARYYASNMGRFMSPDWSAKEEPIPYARMDDPQTLNLYEYLANNPLDGVDADGHTDGPPPYATVRSYSNAQAFRDGALSNLVPLWYLVHHPIESTVSAVTNLSHPRVMYQELDHFANRTSRGDPYALGQLVGFGVLGALVPESRAVEGADAADGLATIGGRKPLNSQYAGGVHPSGVMFNTQGFPDFSPYSIAEVKLKGLTGNYATDSAMANKAMGLPKTPKGYVWHHVQDAETMQLVHKPIHSAARHTGGTAIIRNGGIDKK